MTRTEAVPDANLGGVVRAQEAGARGDDAAISLVSGDDEDEAQPAHRADQASELGAGTRAASAAGPSGLWSVAEGGIQAMFEVCRVPGALPSRVHAL